MGNDFVVVLDGMVYLSEIWDGSLMWLWFGELVFQVLLCDSCLVDFGGLGVVGIVWVDEDILLVGNFGSGVIYVVEGVVMCLWLCEMELF